MRLIDADELAERLDALAYDDWNQGVCTSWANAFKELADMVRDESTADAEPVRHGHWVKSNSDYEWECSSCGYGYTDYRTTYCYDCGAKMDEVKE